MKCGSSHALFAQPAYHAHAVQTGHVDVQKNQFRLQLADQVHGLQAVGTSCNYFDFRKILEQVGELVAGQLLVVHDNSSESSRRAVSHGVGIIAFRLSERRTAILPNQDNVQIAPAEGKLGVLIPGMGAVTTTFIAGLEAIKRGLGKPIGSLTQLGTIRLGKRTEGRSPAIRDFVPLARLEDLEVGCWDIFEDNAYEAAVKAGVLEMPLLEQAEGAAFGHQAHEGGVRPEFRQAHQRPQRQDRRLQDGPRRDGDGRHPAVSRSAPASRA